MKRRFWRKKSETTIKKQKKGLSTYEGELTKLRRAASAR
jgi:hypothetical protein